MTLVQQFPGISRKQWLTNLERKAKSDASIRQQVAENINMRAGVLKSATELFSPVTKATTEASQLNKDELKKLGLEDKFEAPIKASLVQTKLQQDSVKEQLSLSQKSIEKIEQLINIQERYVKELERVKAVGIQTLRRLDENIKEQKRTIEEIKKEPEDADNIYSLSRLFEKYQEEISELPTEHRESLESMSEDTQNEFKESLTGFAAGTSGTKEARNTEDTIKKAYRDENVEEKIKEFAINKLVDEGKINMQFLNLKIDILTNKTQLAKQLYIVLPENRKDDTDFMDDKFKEFFTGYGKRKEESTIQKADKQNIVTALNGVQEIYRDRIKKKIEEERKIFGSVKRKYDQEVTTSLALTEASKPPSSIPSDRSETTKPKMKEKESKISKDGSGLTNLSPSKIEDVNRLQLLLASNTAGNDSGLQEFLKILKKLMRQKIITKTDYNRFVQSWRK